MRTGHPAPVDSYTMSSQGQDARREGGTKSILAAMGANLGIALTKFIAFFVSGASSMLAEAIHSTADTINQILLLIGGRRAQRAADAEHPFGHGRERYVFAFLVSIILFSVGGIFAIYEGIEKIEHPHPLDNWWLPMAVIIISIGLETFSFRTARHEAREAASASSSEKFSLVQFIHRAKAPEIPVVLLEDAAALTGLVLAFGGVGLTAATGNSVWDGIGSVCIGGLLVIVAVVLAVEINSLLIGEGATPETVATIRQAVHRVPIGADIIHMRTLYVGPEELLVALKVGVPSGATADTIAQAIDGIEASIRTDVPEATSIYIEPDIRHAE